MDISPAGPWLPPWPVPALALVVLLVVGLTGAGLLMLLRSHRARSPAAPGSAPDPTDPQAGYRDDDLPGFLEAPPGSAGGSAEPPATPQAGWPALAGPVPVATSPVTGVAVERPAGGSRRSAAVLGAVALTALTVAAAVLAFAARSGTPDHDHPPAQHAREAPDLPPVPRAPEPGQPGAGALADVSVHPGPEGGAARLAFEGLLLEQRAVGITATYPTVEVTWNRDEGVAHLRLPTFNCLASAPPEDPVAAGCAASLTEHADLASPALDVRGDDGAVRLSGLFPTYLRPNGSPPVWTGRVYAFSLWAAPVAGAAAEGWVRAEGEIRLGEGRAATLGTSEVTVLRRN